MDAQVTPIGQRLQRGIGNGADAQLQRRPILDQLPYIPTDYSLRLVGWFSFHVIEGTVPLHGVIQPGNMHEAMAVDPGHVGIDEGDDLPGMIDGRTAKIDGRAHRAKAMLVGGRDLNERHIEGSWSAWHEEFRNTRKKYGDVAGTPGVNSGPFARSDEARVHVKVPHPAWVRVRD